MVNQTILRNKIPRNEVLDEVILKNKIVTFLNPYSYLHYRKDIHLFEKFDIVYIDGIVLVMLLRLLGFNTKRTSFDMTSLAPEVFKHCIKHGKSIYFVGSKSEEILNFIRIVDKFFPEMVIAGFRNGYFSNPEQRQMELNKIKALSPDVVVVGMGTPNQELFLKDLKILGWKGSGFTCGGFIHQTAKGIEYYPLWMDKMNLRWLYRIYDEPALLRRYLISYPKSICLFIFDYFEYKFNAKRE